MYYCELVHITQHNYITAYICPHITTASSVGMSACSSCTYCGRNSSFDFTHLQHFALFQPQSSKSKGNTPDSEFFSVL